MMTGLVHDQNLEKHIEKQMGCMTGFLQIFDRHQLLTGKRLYSTKRLPPTTPGGSMPGSENSVGSPTITRELEKPQTTPSDRFKPSPVAEPRSPLPDVAVPAENPAKSTLPLPIFEYKEATRSPRKFFREAPRLSLDSRAIVDAKGSLYPREIRTNAAILSANRSGNAGDEAVADGADNQRRSTSVIARLMGLEPLPPASPEPMKKAELRRSASESRVSRDLFHSRFIDGNGFQVKQPNQSHSNARRDSAGVETSSTSNGRLAERNARSEPSKASQGGVRGPPWKLAQQRKSFFDSEDFFPEPKQTVSISGEIEKRLKMRGIDEPSRDLETLKQILEALQLKGLLHSKPTTEQIRRRNFVYDRSLSSDESPIVVMKPARLSVSPANRMNGNASPPPSSTRCRGGNRRNLNVAGANLPTVSPRRERPEIDSNMRSPARARNSSPIRIESNSKPTNSLIKRKPLGVEIQRKGNESPEQQRRVSPVQSPRLNSKRFGSDQTATNRSPRNKKPTAEIYRKEKIAVVTEDESSSISESSVSTSSQTDTTERSKMEHKEGRSLLERCDKLLHSIAEITAAAELQPSPVSVLDSSFYKDESSSSPSPVMKRSIDFKEQFGDAEEEIWSSAIWAIQSKSEDQSEDSDYVYISEIFRASHYVPDDSDIFLLLEKQQYLKGKDTTKVSRLQRKLIFDIITEILERNRQLPPWKAFSCSNIVESQPSLLEFRQTWAEFEKIRERGTAEDLFEIICGVLKKDLAGDATNGWVDSPVELSEAVLDIERLIFKDLVGETLRDLASFAGKSIVSVPPRRKLVF